MIFEVIMRSLKKNQRQIHYALFDTEIPIYDENGNEELETRAGYKTPVLFYDFLLVGQSDADVFKSGIRIITGRS